LHFFSLKIAICGFCCFIETLISVKLISVSLDSDYWHFRLHLVKYIGTIEVGKFGLFAGKPC